MLDPASHQVVLPADLDRVAQEGTGIPLAANALGRPVLMGPTHARRENARFPVGNWLMEPSCGVCGKTPSGILGICVQCRGHDLPTLNSQLVTMFGSLLTKLLLEERHPVLNCFPADFDTTLHYVPQPDTQKLEGMMFLYWAAGRISDEIGLRVAVFQLLHVCRTYT